MLGLLAFLFICAKIAEGLRSGPSTEYVVYPRLLEARGINGEKILHINDQLFLRLEKSSAIAEKLVVSSLNGAEQVDTIVDGKEVEKNIYHDKNQMAAVSVSEQNGTLQVTGALGRRLRIAPLPLMGRCEAGCGAHRIFEIEEPEGYNTDYTVPMKRNIFAKRQTRLAAEIPRVFFVEVAIVFDQHHREHFKTKESLLQYAAVTVQLVNMRYDVTSDPKVQFVLVAVIDLTGENTITRTLVAQDVLKPPGYTTRYTISGETLENLATAVNWGMINVTADLVTLVTSTDLADVQRGTLFPGVAGAAYVGGLCNYYRVAETEDKPHTYSMVGLLVHEWGHSLGMVHDGDRAVYSTPAYKYVVCDPREGYIMAPVANGARNGQWSKCSLAHLQGFVRTLGNACFDVTSQKNYTINMTDLPGANMTKKQLCHDTFPDFGPMTFYDYTGMLPECTTVCCSQFFRTCMQTVLTDGMECKHGHHCVKHRCVKK
ncbi:disintegrin and metalloproteinase domain-containing protein 8 [Ixodes scapularis]|uniref:disintegrin and metalloproteinase domain-containing protein 8 n=1 Tax=Ixodes scapularis TaxID=6945 RepID=UPI001A9D0674|nr:disintegrin and metalloproteinase domain-containing protein 8 [Ixodes scapularis]